MEGTGVGRGRPDGHRERPADGFIYPICDDMCTMPGQGADLAAHRIDIDEDGEIVSLS